MINIKALQQILVRGIRSLPDGLDGVQVGCNEVGFVGLEVKEEEEIGLLNAREVEKVALLTKLEFSIGVVPVLNSCALGEDDGIVAGMLREERGDLFTVELGGVLETGPGEHVGGNGMNFGREMSGKEEKGMKERRGEEKRGEERREEG